MSERPIHFYFRGVIRRPKACADLGTVLQYLREEVHATGTKRGRLR